MIHLILAPQNKLKKEEQGLKDQYPKDNYKRLNICITKLEKSERENC